MLSLPPLSLYVHIPWCVRKCPYCDFNSHRVTGDLPENDYVKALHEDLRRNLAYVQGRKLVSVFFGGGTPSLFSGKTIGHIIELADKHIGFEDQAEITLEANPGTIDENHFGDYAKAGVNRVSLGIQSFNTEHLNNLGRIHSGDDARRAISTLERVGLENFNLDLMHGLPGQTVNQSRDDLNTAISYQPTHISWYQLTIEPNTVFFSHPPHLPEEEQLEAIQQSGQQQLLAGGYQQYEVSAWCQTNRQSRHNLNYWEFGDYLGIGAGAHSKITLTQQNRILRYQKTRFPEDYLNPEKAFQRRLTLIAEMERPLEFLLNALRLKQGIPMGYFEARTGVAFQNLAENWQRLEQRGLLEPATHRLNTTDLGYRFLNQVLAELDQ